MSYDGPERRKGLPFSEEERKLINTLIERAVDEAIRKYPLDKVVELAAIKATEKLTNNFYMSVGKGVFNKAIIMLGVLAVAAVLWFESRGIMIKAGK